MSSSRSDDVTKCVHSFVRSFVRPSVVILFRLEHLKHLVLDILRELQGCLRGVCLKFQGSFKDVKKQFQVLRTLILECGSI